MSKERARRRAEREAAAAAERERRERRRARRARWDALVAPFARLTRRRRADSALARQRKRQDGALLAVLLPLHVVIWLLTPSWWVRGSALVLSLLLWPLLTVLFFDRRPTR